MRLYHQVISSLALAVLLLVIFYGFYVNYCLDNGRTAKEKPRSGRPSVNLSREYEVWCIFTKVSQRFSPIKYKLRIMLVSLFNFTSSVVSLNVVTDSRSRGIAQEVVLDSANITGKQINVVYHDINDAMKKMGNVVSSMKPHFTSQPGAYYSDSLFFISLVLHRIAPESQKRVVMLDVDTKLEADVVELFAEFDRFGKEALIGAGHELSPVYRHVLYWWRGQHKGSKLGNPASTGGFPGLNSGVLLLDLARLRESALYRTLLLPQSVASLARKYSFKGHLGDQDFYTLVALDHPELFHIIDCGWNRQLCTWWRDHGYHETFDAFATCDSPVKIYHGNCNTPLPRM